ncbi:MAG TPA: SpvB/TcaC N-terminal domain-containing protein, partial [Myxococcota bacterium]
MKPRTARAPTPSRSGSAAAAPAIQRVRRLLARAGVFIVAALSTALPAWSAHWFPTPEVSAPSDILSPGGGAVDGNTGAATLRIPIAAPPGPGGLAPELALVYSSHSADGPFGVGWRLPLGEIRCAARFGVPNFADCSHYELDGQLLVEDPARLGRYHTRVESFQRIERRSAGDAGDSWEVTRTNGAVLRYGTHENARVRADGLVARWLLRQIEDTHGNRIDIEYERDELAEPGTAYPRRITYAGGSRQIEFLYEARPDPLHDFASGIERFVERRLREIRVTSAGAVFQRRIFGYDAPGDYTTLRSRLVWTQLFGTDCPTSHPLDLVAPATAPLGPDLCTPLPAEQYAYTDTGRAPGSNWTEAPQWAPPTDLQFFPDWGTDQNLMDPGVRFADVDGDGRIDLVHAYCTQADWPCDEPGGGDRAVYLNTGSGWQESPAWTAALQSLTYEQPSVSVPDRDACDLQVVPLGRGVVFSEWHYYLLPAQNFDGQGHFVSGQADFTYRPLLSWQLVDLDGDGLADLVTSESFGGIARRDLDCDGAPTGGDFVPGADVRAAFRNTGSGWVRDDSLASGLPRFSTVMIDDREGSGVDCREGYLPESPGLSRRGGYEYGTFAHDGIAAGAPCMTILRFHPVFLELDGDGRPELIALEPHDANTPWLHVGNVSSGGGTDHWSGYAPEYENPYYSRAWRQVASGGWRRAPDFDLDIPHTYTAFGSWDFYMYAGGGQWDTDNGTRFADLNRDGLIDVLRSSNAALNRGAGDGRSGSAWCRSYGGC